MILLTIEELQLLHRKLIVATGGSDGIREYGLLESAVNSMYAGYGDVEQYPTVEEKAARLAFSLVSNHAFVDGNKRIGVLALLMMLKLNDIDISYTQTDLIQLGLNTAKGEYHYDDIYQWIQNHKADQG